MDSVTEETTGIEQGNAVEAQANAPSTLEKNSDDTEEIQLKKPRKPRAKRVAPTDTSIKDNTVVSDELQGDVKTTKKRRRKESSEQQQEVARCSSSSTVVPSVQGLYKSCDVCGQGTPFCAMTGKAHQMIEPCKLCGLTSAFCPMSGQPHKSASTSTTEPTPSKNELVRAGVSEEKPKRRRSEVQREPRKQKPKKEGGGDSVVGEIKIDVSENPTESLNMQMPSAELSTTTIAQDTGAKKERKPRAKKGDASPSEKPKRVSKREPKPSMSCARCKQVIKVTAVKGSRSSAELQNETGPTLESINAEEAREVVEKRPPKALVTCGVCSRSFHRSCYLADTPMTKKKVVATPNLSGEMKEDVLPGTKRSCQDDLLALPCVCCISGVIPMSMLERSDATASVDETPDAAWFGTQKSTENLSSEFTVDGAVKDFLRYGFCKVPLIPELTLDEKEKGNPPHWVEIMKLQTQLTGLKSTIMKYSQALHSAHELNERNGQISSLAEGYANYRERSSKRFEILAPFIPETIAPLIEKSDIKPILERLLESHTKTADETVPEERKMKQMSSGCFLSMPESVVQPWHTDGPSLSSAENLFPYAVNVFLPLVDVGPMNGTEFQPGTQLSQRPKDMPGEDLQIKTVPTAEVGYALLFDYRVTHRGMGNRSADARPCCYVTYSQHWYTDVFNFGSDRYAKELQVPSHLLESRGDRLARRIEQQQSDEVEE